MPDGLEVFRNIGSLTTPNRREGVLWNVLAAPITLSSGQIAAFEHLFSGADFPEGKRRPVQPLNGSDLATGCEDDYED